jgi:protein SCO1/2
MLSSKQLLLRSAAALICSVSLASAQYGRPKITEGVGISQKLNAPVPLDLVFHDENNQIVPLRTYFGDKPVILEVVYFNCTSLCPMTLMESVNSLKRVSLEPGRDYNVVVVSIDPHDTPAMAREKKDDYAGLFAQKPVRSEANFNAGWHFLTGSQESISRLASAVGFRYRWDEASKQFIHAGGIMVATPEGKLSRYFYGVQYAPPDLRMALVDASQHRIGNPVDYITLFCFHYDATQGKYTLAIVNILKLGGALTIVGLAGLIYFLMRNDKKKRPRVTWREVRHVG